MAKDANGKLTYEMKSPGEAWMDHVNNQLNAKAVTPEYLKESDKDLKKAATFKQMAPEQNVNDQPKTVAKDKSAPSI